MIQFIFILFSVFILIIVVDHVTGIKLINKYKIVGIFGKPGSGKSTYLTSQAYKHVKRGWDVYTDNATMCTLPGVKYFDSQEFKAGRWLPDGRNQEKPILLIFDEIGSLYNNRDFKSNLTSETLRWWKEHRHKKVKVIYGSQSYNDMDLKIRALSDTLKLIKRSMLWNFSVIKPILITLDIQNDDHTATGGKIVEKYSYDFIIFWRWLFLPKWIKKFDSYN